MAVEEKKDDYTDDNRSNAGFALLAVGIIMTLYFASMLSVFQ